MQRSSIQKRDPPSGGRSTARSKYAHQACQECRRRRAKCDSQRPCERCLNRGTQCVYLEGSDNRGTAPKSLVSLLQTRIKLLEQVLWLHSIDVDASIAGMKARGAMTSDGAREAATSSASEKTSNETNGALCSDESLDFNGEGEARYFGLTSGRIELLHSASELTDKTSPLSVNMSTRPPLALGNQAIDPATDISRELMDHLVDLYFEWEHPWYYILDEDLFRRSWQDKGRYCNALLLNCIFALGSRYSDRSELRASAANSDEPGQLFLEVAEVLLHFELKSPTITTIQSVAIMAMVYVAMGQDAKGWLLHGMSVRMALDMGLNLDSTTLNQPNQLPPEEMKLRSQIYWTLYCTDKLWASYTGRVCTMLDFQAAVSLPPPSLSVNRSAVPDASSFNRSLLQSMLHYCLCTQCQILEKILINLYAPKRLPAGGQRQAFFDSCLLELKRWKYNLPVELDPKHSGKEDTLPQAYILNMVYHTSIILLVKPFLPRSSEEAPQSTPDSTINPFSLCMEAAREICLLGERYRRAFGSFRKSPITATHSTLSAALVILYAQNPGEKKPRDTNFRLLESCLTTLRELSEAWVPARRYWQGLLHIVKSRYNSQHNDPKTASSAIINPGPDHEDRRTAPFFESIPEARGSPMDTANSYSSDSGFLNEDYGSFNIDSWSPSQSPFTQDELMMLDIPFWIDLSQELDPVPATNG